LPDNSLVYVSDFQTASFSMPRPKLTFLVLLASALVWSQSELSPTSLSRRAGAKVAANQEIAALSFTGPVADCGEGSAVPCDYSALWGVKGEKWKPEERLPDFSYAGYHAGEAAIPNPRAHW